MRIGLSPLKHVFLIAFVLAVMAPAASAQSSGAGHYFSFGIGADFPRDASLNGTGVDLSLDADRGVAALGAFGHRYGNGWRSELELGWSSVGADALSGTAASGKVTSLSGMANLVRDFEGAYGNSALTPYLGLGLGGARINYDGLSPVGGSRIDDSDLVFAYQAIAGASYRLDDGLSLIADYRYFGTADPDFSTDSGTSVSSEFASHRIMVGLRWDFGAPAPKPEPRPVAAAPAPMPAPAPAPVAAPEPAPAPVVAQTYLVFFDWDKSDIRPDAAAILVTAADGARAAKPVRIRTTGHADRSGTDAYNMALSQRRAEAVQRELVRLGVPADDIAVLWKGEREPLVATPDGIREPQNRRVEIVFE